MKVFLPLIVIFLGGCAAVQQNEARQKERWLQQAGFQTLKADTPQKQAALSKMTPYKIESKFVGNTVAYRYANPRAGLLFVGGAAEYAAYKDIQFSTKARRVSNLAQMTSSNARVIGPLMW